MKNKDQILLEQAYKKVLKESTPKLDFSKQWEDFKKYKTFQEALPKLDKDPNIENLVKISLEEPNLPTSFTHPDLWENVQEIAKKVLKTVKDKTSQELIQLKENPNTKEELYIAYMLNSSRMFFKGGKADLVRVLNRIIKEDRWEMLMQNRENVYL